MDVDGDLPIGMTPEEWQLLIDLRASASVADEPSPEVVEAPPLVLGGGPSGSTDEDPDELDSAAAAQIMAAASRFAAADRKSTDRDTPRRL